MATKFCRGLLLADSGLSSNAKVAYIMKFLYEFWGFCINGSSSLIAPGGFAATTPSTMPGNFNGTATTIAVASNGASLPQATINVASTTGFPSSGTIYVYTSSGTQTVTYTGVTGTTFTGCSGGTGTMSTGGNVSSSSLLTLGSDGYTNASTSFRYDGYTDFFATSAPFTSNMVNKILTTWKSGSGSSEDGVYKIIAFKSANNIVIDINSGGTPSILDGYKPSVTTRTSINYRVTDVTIAANATSDANYFVMQMDPTGINVGQANSQCKLTIANTNFQMNAQLSPGGTWNGSAFTEGTTTIVPNYNTNTILSNVCSGSLYINMVGDKDFLIYLLAFSGATTHSWMHLEIPERLYTQAQDTNPITISLNARDTTDNIQFNTSQTTAGYGGGFVMKCSDGTTRNHRTSVKSLVGDGNANLITSGVANIPGASLSDFRAGANPTTGNILNSQAVLTLPGVTGQFSLARVKLRKCIFANIFMPQFTRFSSNGDFILVGTKGAAIPWDKTVLPYSLWRF